MTSVLLSAKAELPPLIVPPLSVQEPVALFNVKRLAGLLIVPVTFTVPVGVAPGADAAGGVERAAQVHRRAVDVDRCPHCSSSSQLIVKMPPPVASKMPVRCWSACPD